jgi:predicted nucleic acid-binding protein
VRFLLDSNVVSELRKNRPHGAVIAWLHSLRAEDIGVPAIVLGELQAGAEITRKQDTAKAADLDRWIDEIANGWEVVDLDAAIAREWARLVDRRTRSLFEDAMIAATARVHSLIVVTRNTKDFESFDVEVLNPFHFK